MSRINKLLVMGDGERDSVFIDDSTGIRISLLVYTVLSSLLKAPLINTLLFGRKLQIFLTGYF